MCLKILVLLLSVISAAFAVCPVGCRCTNNVLARVAYCSPKSADQLHTQIVTLPPNVVELHIGNQGIKICNVGNQLLSNTFLDAPETLANLYIEKCNLKSISATAFSGMKNLQNLFIIRNPITSLPNALLKDLVGLNGFIVEGCPLTTLAPEVFTSAACFRELVISGTDITDLDAAFVDLQCITNLNVSRNHLSTIKKSMFTGMLNLAYLDISYNMGVVLEEMVFNKLTKLRELSMAGITHDGAALPTTILSGIPQLVHIDVTNNGFTDISKLVLFLKDVLKIQYLDASGNDLKALNDGDLVVFTQLTNLRLTHCNITTLQKDSLQGLTNLDTLDLSRNAIESIPDDVFLYSTNITMLRLANNGLNLISGNSFAHLNSSNYIDLHGSSLSRLTKDMFPSNLASLLTLDLRTSTINSIDRDSFNSLTGIRKINLNGNHIHEIPKELLKSLADKGVILDISQNDWNCNCDMFFYREWMKENAVNFSMICSEPEAVRGKNVIEMSSKEEFGCRAPLINDCCHYKVTFIEGDEADFKCISSGDPTPTLSLSVLGGDPLPKNRTRISSDNSTIVVMKLEVGDSGNFSCTATNIWGTVTTYYELKVMALPTYYMSGGVIGLVVVLVLIIIALVAVLLAWQIKHGRSKDRSSLITNQGVDD